MKTWKTLFNARLLFVTTCALAAQEDLRVALPISRVEIDGGFQGKPDNEQAHSYRSHERAPHTASGDGLHKATVGMPASFTIQLVGDNLGDFHVLLPNWERIRSRRFIYVWIANEDQILTAEVVDGGRKDGTLTATYKSDFPGNYSVHIEEVQLSKKGEGVPILGSPFSLTIAGDAPTLNVNSLPVCSSDEDANTDIADTFWRPGTWLSSNVASAAHGVMRNGWVFQPKSCVFDTFSYEDLMLLASIGGEPTWLLVLGGSVERGVFLTLIDMVLAAGQKQGIRSSVLNKCWGYADVRVGNLRLTYQDMRLFRFTISTDSVACNNEKLTSESTSALVHSAGQFLASTVFQDGGQWPTMMMAASRLIPTRAEHTQFSVEVLMDAMPPSWEGKLFFVDHMAGLGNYWTEENPTMTALKNVGIWFDRMSPDDDNGLGKMDGYQTRDPRVSFMSVFPMYQAKLFENEGSRNGIRRFAGSQHFHYISKETSAPETRNGTIMVHSTITEMLANVILGRAVETKASLHAKAAASKDEIQKLSSEVGKSFQVCWDCPGTLLPFHVKPIPEPVCEILESLPGGAKMGDVWSGSLCPDWCMKQEPVSQKNTQSDVVDVRMCSARTHQP
ncbi:unnamed protein product [Ectocarpus sp. CCAP 1310/34]|nr:unnamed protein product [Ectocarpus sp. CCAP 1310/34]